MIPDGKILVRKLHNHEWVWQCPTDHCEYNETHGTYSHWWDAYHLGAMTHIAAYHRMPIPHDLRSYAT